MAERADEFYQPKPGTDLVWLGAVTKYIIDHDLHDKAFLDEWVDDFEKYYESLAPFTMAFAEEATGIPQSRLINFAKEVAKAESVSICWAMGITQQDIGSDSSTAISNLLLVTGNYRNQVQVLIRYVVITMFKVVAIWVACLTNLQVIKSS